MAEETLVKEALSKEMIDSGRELVRALLQRQVELTACFWLYSSERNDWRLVVAFPQVEKEGPLKAYETIQSVIRPLGAQQTTPEGFRRLLRLTDVSVLEPSNRLVRSVQSVPLFDEDGMQFKQSRLGDSFVEGVYIYNLSQLS
jgi:hypothetical protein